MRIMSGGPLEGSYQMLQLHFHWGQASTKCYYSWGFCPDSVKTSRTIFAISNNGSCVCVCQDDSRGSEHTLNGSPFPLELHIVHKRTDLGTADIAMQTHHGLAVAGFFFKIGVIRNQLAKISMTVCQL